MELSRTRSSHASEKIVHELEMHTILSRFLRNHWKVFGIMEKRHDLEILADPRQDLKPGIDNINPNSVCSINSNLYRNFSPCNCPCSGSSSRSHSVGFHIWRHSSNLEQTNITIKIKTTWFYFSCTNYLARFRHASIIFVHIGIRECLKPYGYKYNDYNAIVKVTSRKILSISLPCSQFVP